MSTLYINAPNWRADADDAKTFARTLASGKGDGYAIPQADADRCRPGMRVVLLCQDAGRRAEGRLKRLVPSGTTGSGMVRYDVYMDGLAETMYARPPMNLRRTGILVTAE